MLKACKYCGRIHDEKYRCPKRPPKRRGDGDPEIRAFRGSKRWTKRSKQIRDRDRNLCQVCLRNLFMTHQTLTFSSVSVHHIVPLAERRDLALDGENLITLCPFHHELAEQGHIPRETLREIAREQEAKLSESE